MRKINIYTLAALIAAGGIVSCKKEKVVALTSSSLTIVNAIADGTTIVPNFDSSKKLIYYISAQPILINSFFQFSGYTGDIPLALSEVTDTTHTIYNHVIHAEPGTVHSLFVMGTVNAPDYLYTEDQIKPITDSVVSVRFVNLYKGNNPVSINIKGSQITPVVNDLAYKGMSSFQPFVTKKAIPATGNYIFEIRDAVTGNLLTTYTLNTLLPVKDTPGGKIFRHYTLAYTGSTTQATILINNY